MLTPNQNANNINDKLQALKSQYLIQLKKRLPEIALLVEKIKDNHDFEDSKEELRSLVHKLAGTGGTYGYQDVTKTARILENTLVNYLQENKKVEDIMTQASNLLKACETALVDFSPSDAVAAAPAGLTEIQANRRTMYKIDRSQGVTKKPLIILVEDDEIIVHYIIELFKNTTDILLALDANEAELISKEYKPDLVLLANRLTGQDVGISLLKKLKSLEETKNSQIIMITSTPDPDLITAARANGAVEFIFKPFIAGDVQLKINKRLNIQTD